MTREINEAILLAHTSGQLTGAALMMGQPGTEEAVEMARAHPSLEVGWHLHLNDSIPTTTERWPWGASPAHAGWSIGLLRQSADLMRREVARQWQLFQETGLECRFINSHHHLHSHPFVYRALHMTIGEEYPGWIRLGRPCPLRPGGTPLLWSALGAVYLERRRKKSPWRSTDTLWGLDRVFDMRAAEVRATLSTLPDGFHEFLFHPRTLSCPDTTCLLELKSSPL